jgi:NADH dehydrogenase
MLGFRISGFSAWFMWRSVYLLKLPTWSRRIKVGLDWFSDLIFPRELGTLRAGEAQPVASAYYRPGDFIFRQGDPANSFYGIQEGEVEVLRRTGDSDHNRAFAFLGPGDFFGEAALVQEPCYQISVRALTVVRVMVMSSSAFSKVAGMMAPSRGILAGLVSRRSRALWLHFPDLKDALSKQPLSSFLEPPPLRTLKPDSTLQQALTALAVNGVDFLIVLDDEQRLLGILKAEQVANALLSIVSTPEESRRDATQVRVRELLAAGHRTGHLGIAR